MPVGMEVCTVRVAVRIAVRVAVRVVVPFVSNEAVISAKPAFDLPSISAPDLTNN